MTEKVSAYQIAQMPGFDIDKRAFGARKWLMF
jgi:hypothetical protein